MIFTVPLPISLGSFVHDYFRYLETGVNWTNDVEINDQKALQFFVPKAGIKPTGIGAGAFTNRNYILTVSTPVELAPEGDLKQLVNEKTLSQLTEIFLLA